MAPNHLQLKKQAENASYLLDVYQKSGGKHWYRFEKVLTLWADWLEKLEEVAYKIYYLYQKGTPNYKLIDELLMQNLRSEDGLLSAWNNFCLEFIGQQKNYIIGKRLDAWQSFLLYRFSDSFWMPLVPRKTSILDQVSSVRLNFFKNLWHQNPDDIIKNFDMTLNHTEFSFTKGCLSNIFKQTSTKKYQLAWLNNALLPSDDFNNTRLQKWQNFWEKSSGGILSQSNFFKLEDAHSFNLKVFLDRQVKTFDQLIENETHQKNLIANIHQLLKGNPAFHVLLWGEPGMGKSSSVLALIPYFKKYNLKLIEISPAQIFDLSIIFKQLSARPEKFILFCDDLMFDGNSPNSKHLNSMLEGSLIKTTNVSLHVTSNRSTIVKLSPNQPNDAIQKNQLASEIGALSDRFGLKLYFEAPKFEKLNQFIVKYAAKYKIPAKNIPQILKKFREFCLLNSHALPSARNVEQFFNQL